MVHPGGRPPKEIDWKVFQKLCFYQCTHEEIASCLDVCVDTLQYKAKKHYQIDSFSEIYKKFSEGGKSSLRRTQFKLSKKNTAMAIWLGKVYLGQREQPQDNKELQELADMFKQFIETQRNNELQKIDPSRTPEIPLQDNQQGWNIDKFQSELGTSGNVSVSPKAQSHSKMPTDRQHDILESLST